MSELDWHEVWTQTSGHVISFENVAAHIVVCPTVRACAWGPLFSQTCWTCMPTSASDNCSQRLAMFEFDDVIRHVTMMTYTFIYRRMHVTFTRVIVLNCWQGWRCCVFLLFIFDVTLYYYVKQQIRGTVDGPSFHSFTSLISFSIRT